jgi:hypothetical protein
VLHGLSAAYCQSTHRAYADIAVPVAGTNDRRKLRLKHQRIMLTLDRQLVAVLTGSSGPRSPAPAGDHGTDPQPSVPGVDSAALAAVREQASMKASMSQEHASADDSSRRSARTPLGRLEGIGAAEETKRQCSAVWRRPISAPATLQRGIDPAAAATPAEPAAASAHWLPASGELHGGQDADKPQEVPGGNSAPANGGHSVSQIVGSFGGPAWGATEVRCPALDVVVS